jgi:hypothetical protein
MMVKFTLLKEGLGAFEDSTLFTPRMEPLYEKSRWPFRKRMKLIRYAEVPGQFVFYKKFLDVPYWDIILHITPNGEVLEIPCQGMGKILLSDDGFVYCKGDTEFAIYQAKGNKWISFQQNLVDHEYSGEILKVDAQILDEVVKEAKKRYIERKSKNKK